MTKRIPANRVVTVNKAAIVAGSADTGTHPITVIPLVSGNHVAGLEIRCRCGAHVVVDCVYDESAVAAVAPEEGSVT